MNEIYCTRCGEYLGQRGWNSPDRHRTIDECFEYLRERIEKLEAHGA